MKPAAGPAVPASKKQLRMGHTVAALVPSDMQLVGSPLFACAAICIFPGNDDRPPVFDLLGVPPTVVNVGGQAVALATLARLPLQYMGTTKRALGWCWPEEFDPGEGLTPAKLVH